MKDESHKLPRHGDVDGSFVERNIVGEWFFRAVVSDTVFDPILVSLIEPAG